MSENRQADQQVRAAAGPYRRRRLALLVLAHIVLLLPAFALGIAALTADSSGSRGVFLALCALCMLAAGGASTILQGWRGQWVLDRLPLAPPASRLAHHALHLHAVCHDVDQTSGLSLLLAETRPILDATAYTARRLHRRLHEGTPRREAARDLADFAADAAAAVSDRLLAILEGARAAPSTLVMVIHPDEPDEDEPAATFDDTWQELTLLYQAPGIVAAADQVLALTRRAISG